MKSTDQELLRLYLEHGAQDAFSALVGRYVDLVYSAALRQVRSPQLAEEVVQNVFIDLARGAAKLRPDTVLAAWLHTVTRRRAADVQRREWRHRELEHVVTETAAVESGGTAWSQLEAEVDEALASLGERDRSVILLRFFENKRLRDVGAELGVSEDAAQKRLSRALDRLRSHLVSRGIATSTAALGAQLSAHAVQAAPATLAPALTAVIAKAGLGAGVSAIAAGAAGFLMTTTQKLVSGAVVTLALGAGVYEGYIILEQRRHIRELEARSARLREERDDANRRVAVMRREVDATDHTLSEAERLLEGAAQQAAAGEIITDPELIAWVARAKTLKEWAARMPERTIPEMQYVSEVDWMEASRRGQVTSEDGARQALNKLRDLAKRHFGDKLQVALTRYSTASGGAPPLTASALSPYFGEPIDPAILNRYEVVSPDGNWEIREREGAMVDEEYENRYSFSVGGGVGARSWNRASAVLERALNEYRAANGGSSPTEAAQILPYVPDPNDRAVQTQLEAWTRMSHRRKR